MAPPSYSASTADLTVANVTDFNNVIPDEIELSGDNAQKPKTCLGSRHLMSILLFFGFFVSYALRINISVAIVAMVNQTAIAESSHSNASSGGQCIDPNDDYEYIEDDDAHDAGGSLEWSTSKQGLILGAFYYGFCVTQMPGGFIAERYGGKLPFGIGLGIASGLTLLNPIVAKTNALLLIFVRALQGLVEGVTLPAFYVMASKWFPEQEKSFLGTFVMSGMSFGMILTLPISGILAEKLGWESIFYVTGGIGVVWSIVFFFMAASTPQEYKRISRAELKYIEATTNAKLPGNFGATLPMPPFGKIIKSKAFWACVTVHFGNNFGYFTLMSGTPLYLFEIQNFALEENGILSAIPYLLNLFVALLVGFLSDKSISSWNMSKTLSRKLFTAIGCGGTGLGLIWLSFVNCKRIMAIVALCISTGINAFVYGGYVINYTDMSPNYMGTVIGMANTVAGTSGFLAPLVTGAITSGNQTIEGWRIVFLLGASICILATTVFVVFGSGDRQAFDEIPTMDKESEKTAGVTKESCAACHCNDVKKSPV